jgi:hypothetical protein
MIRVERRDGDFSRLGNGLRGESRLPGYAHGFLPEA